MDRDLLLVSLTDTNIPLFTALKQKKKQHFKSTTNTDWRDIKVQSITSSGNKTEALSSLITLLSLGFIKEDVHDLMQAAECLCESHTLGF